MLGYSRVTYLWLKHLDYSILEYEKRSKDIILLHFSFFTSVFIRTFSSQVYKENKHIQAVFIGGQK